MRGLGGPGIFVVSTLSIFHVTGFSNGLLTPPLWDLINCINDDSFLFSRFSSYLPRSIENFSEALLP